MASKIQQNGNEDPNHDHLFIAVASIFVALSFSALIMRLASKRIKRTALDYDDYLVILSWIITLAQSITVAYGTQYSGLGRHVYTLPPAKVTAFLKAYYSLSFLQTTALATAKFSALYLLQRIFITRTFRITVRILGLIVLLWWISMTTAFAFICSPIRFNWEPEIPHRCGNRRVVLLFAPIPWVLTDFAILIAPLFVIKDLQLRGTAKAELCALFMTGGLTCIIACVRFKTLFETITDVTWDSVDVGVWSIVETNVTVFCVCLITTRPAFQYLSPAALLLKIRRGWSRLKASALGGSSRGGIPQNAGLFGSSTGLHHNLPQAAMLQEDSRHAIPLGNFKTIPQSNSEIAV